MKELDCIELIVEKKKYTEDGVQCTVLPAHPLDSIAPI